MSEITIPDFLSHLPRAGAYPIPYFVGLVGGKYDFRYVHATKAVRVATEGRCWICGLLLEAAIFPVGHPVGTATFCVGPLGLANRYTTEGHCHERCAVYAFETCPYLNGLRPYRRDEQTVLKVGKTPVGGDRTRPPCMAQVTAASWTLEATHPGGYLHYGYRFVPVAVQWWQDGKRIGEATAKELYGRWPVWQTYLAEKRAQQATEKRLRDRQKQIEKRMRGRRA